MEADALTADEFNSVVSAVTEAFGDPTRREIYLFATDRGRHRRHRGGGRALRACTRTSPVTTSRSSPVVATSWSRSARWPTAPPTARGGRRSAPRRPRWTRRSRSPSSTTTSASPSSRSTRSVPSRPRSWPTRSASSTAPRFRRPRMDPTKARRPSAPRSPRWPTRSPPTGSPRTRSARWSAPRCPSAVPSATTQRYPRTSCPRSTGA